MYLHEESLQCFRKSFLPCQDLLDQRAHPSFLRHIQDAHVTTHEKVLVHLVQNRERMRAQTTLNT